MDSLVKMDISFCLGMCISVKSINGPKSDDPIPKVDTKEKEANKDAHVGILGVSSVLISISLLDPNSVNLHDQLNVANLQEFEDIRVI